MLTWFNEQFESNDGGWCFLMGRICADSVEQYREKAVLDGLSGSHFTLCQARKVTEMGLCEVVAWVPSTFHHFLLLLFINNGKFKFVLSRGEGGIK